MKLLTLMPADLLKRLLLLFCFPFLLFSFADAQESTVSPYSRYGLGDLQFGGFCSEISMGGISSGLRDPFHINYSNPASYSSIRFTTLEASIKGQWVDFKTQNNISGKGNSVSFSYLSIAFPVKKGKWGASFGLIPYSNVGYDIKAENKILLDSVRNVNYLFNGNGGVSNFYLGTGFTILKNLNIGINISYLFGKLENTTRIEFPDNKTYFNTKRSVVTNLSDFYFNYGLQYVLHLKKEQQLTIGVSGGLTTKIKSSNDLVTVNYVYGTFGVESTKDTVVAQFNTKGNTTLPFLFTGGLAYKKGEKWLVGLDYSYQNWSKFQSFGRNDSLNDSYRIAFGVQLTPSYNSRNFLKRIQYRAGLRYAQTYLNLNSTAVNEYGATFGLGIPLKIKSAPRVLPAISFAVEAGQRGTTENNLLRERYWRVHFGITISEEWFIPRKFD